MEKQTVQDHDELADKAKQFMPGGEKVRAPLVSLVITNYNYSRFIEDCLASICAQTYQNFECIIVDDVSTDNSIEVIEAFIASEPKAAEFKLVALEQNGGQMNAFIEGFAHASGAFVVFVDADDFLFSDFLETHLAMHLNPRYAAALSCSNETVVDGENRVLCHGIENWPWRETSSKIAPNMSTKGTVIHDWRQSAFLDRPADHMADSATFVDPSDNPMREWIWSTTSAIMFRRGVLEAIFSDQIRDIRICADYYLLHFAHLIGGTLLIHTPHGCYRRHGTNNFALNPTMGTGTRTWSPSNDVDFGALLDLIFDEILKELPKFQSILSEARIYWILASLAPISRVPRILASIGARRPKMIIEFLGLFSILYGKRVIGQIIRRLKFV